MNKKWVVPEKIHTLPMEEFSAVWRGREEKIASDNSKRIRTSEGGRGVNFLFPLWGWYGCFLEGPNKTIFNGVTHHNFPVFLVNNCTNFH